MTDDDTVNIVGMPVRHMAQEDIGRQLGKGRTTVNVWRSRFKDTPDPFPEPDVETGLGDHPLPGWLPERMDDIRAWLGRHPPARRPPGGVRLMDRPRADLTDLGEATCTWPERATIGALQRLAKHWPKTLTLVSMDGGIQVVRTDAYHAAFAAGMNGAERQEACVLADIDAIPNDGGGW